jgi:hypothetical protein
MLRPRPFPLLLCLGVSVGLLATGRPSSAGPADEPKILGIPAGLVHASAQAFGSREAEDALLDSRPDMGEVTRLRVVPDEFVGDAEDCGPGYPAGARIVQAQWLRGLGLPDNGSPNSNPADPTDNPAKRNPHYGLLLSKNGPTPDCSAAGARLLGTPRRFTIRRLGYDYRNGSNCGAGAPRFNVTTPDGRLYFVGCTAGTRTPAPQDPQQWTRVRFANEDFFPSDPSSPPFEMGVTAVRRIEIVHDEGTDVPQPEAPAGIGLIVLDNIVLNSQQVRGPRRTR